MKIFSETNLCDFNFWCGAKNHRNRFSLDELRQLECILDELYYDGISNVQLNDLFWFDCEFLCECLGIDYDDWECRNDDYIYKV